jgi:hypothetical protein
MPHPMTGRDQSAYADSIKRLTIAMREMLGMGAQPPTVRTTPSRKRERAPCRLESHNG